MMNWRTTIIHSLQSRGWLLLMSTAIILLNTRTLGAEGQGTIAWIQLGILAITAVGGFLAGGAVVYLQRHIALRDTLIPGHVWLIFCAITVAWIGASLGALPDEFAWEMGVLGWLQGVVIFHGQLLVSMQAVKQYNRIQVMQTALLALGLFGMYSLTQNPRVALYLIALGGSLVLTAASSSWMLRSLLQRSSVTPIKTTLKWLWKHGSASQSGALLQLLTNRSSFSLLSQMAPAGASAAGVYSVAFYGMEAIWAVARGLAPVVHSRTVVTSDVKDRLVITRGLLYLTWMFTLPLTAIAAAIPDVWYKYIFGFGGIQPLMKGLAPAVITGAAASILAHHLSGIGQHRWNAWTSGVGLAVLLLVALQCIPFWGSLGAAWAASAAGIIQFSGLLFGLYRTEGIRLRDWIPRSDDWTHW